mgnify:CR=1 FL=1
MSALCLDTSGYSHFKRGEPEIVALLQRARSVCVPSIVIGELRVGFRLGRKPEDNEQQLREFLQQPVVEVLDVDEQAASLYADIFVDLRKRGTPLPSNDIWIAALAMRKGAVVVTYDAHFEAIEAVGCRVLGRGDS